MVNIVSIGDTKTSTFIAKAVNVHGDVYSYADSVYAGTHTKLFVECSIHGQFSVTPNNHISRGSGCPKCGVIKRASNRTLTLDRFISNSILVHGDVYDYSNVVYENVHSHVEIICPTHGTFSKTPAHHLYQSQGCPDCSSYTFTDFYNRAVDVHGKRYQYPTQQYINGSRSINITCMVHGEFNQTPANHLLGHGCSKCSGSYTPTAVEFIDDCSSIHHNAYDYSLVVYSNLSSLIDIICPVHGTFNQHAGNHRRGSMCPTCVHKLHLGYTDRFFDTYPWKRTQHATLYVIELHHSATSERFLKIGITTRSVDTRSSAMLPYTSDCLLAIPCTLEQAFEIERHTLDELDKVTYTPQFKFSGWTECFKSGDVTLLYDTISTKLAALEML